MRAWLPCCVVAVGLAACARAAQPSAAPPAASSAPSTAQAAPVVLAIVVDQLAAWVADERLPLLPTGGFSRLRREGTWLHQLTYLHASTETAPGHAALFTGKLPRENGIVGNATWTAELGRVSPLDDAHTQLVDASGRTGARGVSLERLRVPTLADALRARDPEAVVIALSLKDRGAIFAGGRTPTLSAWHDEKRGTLVTSDALCGPASSPALPEWTRPLARPFSAPGVVEWTLLDPAFVAAHARRAALPIPDAQAGENGDFGGVSFPHRLAVEESAPERGYRAFRGAPAADHWLIDLALLALDRTRQPAHPMLLALSLSTNDYVGHAYGPESWEAWDELLRLNSELARLFRALDARLGPSGYSVLLTGDHGVAPLPELAAQAAAPWCADHDDPFERPCSAGTRLHEESLRKALSAALEPAFTPSPVAALVESVVYLTDAARRFSGPERARLDALVRQALLANPAVADVVPLTREPCPPADDESLPALVCRATLPGFGDYYLIPKRGSFLFGGELGTSHGTPYRYDRAVPLLVRYGQGGRAGGAIEKAPFGVFYDSAWYALTGEVVAHELGGVLGRAQ